MTTQLLLEPQPSTRETVSTRLSARLALRSFLEPRRYAMPEWEKEIAESARAIRLSSGHGGLSWGRGEPVLLAHGWEGRVTQRGRFVAPLVARGFQVIGFTAPAHGGNSERTLTVIDYAHFLRMIVREFGPLRGVIGHSMGAAAIGFAMPMGLEVGRAVLISVVNSVDTAARRLERLLGLSPDTVAVFRRRLAREVFDAPLDRLAVTEHAAHFKTPALLLATDDDQDIAPQDTDDLAAVWPGAQLRVLAGAGGHRKILRDERTVEAAVNFIAAADTLTAPSPAAHSLRRQAAEAA